jgi:LPS export ABC transporter protein LptC
VKRRLPVALIAVAALAIAAVRWAVREPSPPAQRLPAPQVSVGLEKADLILRHKGTRQAEIHAQRVLVSKDLRTARFVGIAEATVYDPDGEPLRVTAGEIVLDRQTNDLQIRGPVVVTSSRGYRLEAPEARWRHAGQQIVFPRGVQVRQGAQRLQAGRLVVDAGLTSFELSGGVEIIFSLEGVGP